MTGVLKSGSIKPNHNSKGWGSSKHDGYDRPCYESYKNIGWNVESSSGGASRFFYCAKASSSERNRGLEGLPLKECDNWPQDLDPGATRKANPRANNHPTVKPLALMKYILKLLAPPGNPICLDPFAGSGSTLVAAKELGISCIGIEKEVEYVEIASKRIA
jgi:site-specific DNA-methyltransferase (adenine-specific)